MEKGVFPHLHSLTDNQVQTQQADGKLIVDSFQFCILTTHLNPPLDLESMKGRDDNDDDDDDNPVEHDSMEIFHFHLFPSEGEKKTDAIVNVNVNAQSLRSGEKPLVEQLKAAMENIVSCLEETKWDSSETIAIVSVNMIMKFQQDSLERYHKDDVHTVAVVSTPVPVPVPVPVPPVCEDDDIPSLAVQPEFFSKSDTVHPLGILQGHAECGSNDTYNTNDIMEMEMEMEMEPDQDEEGALGYNKYSTQGDYQNRLIFREQEQLAQTLQSQDSRGRRPLEEGRREIARVLLPHHSVVILREYRVIDHDVRHQEEELKELFPYHRAQVMSAMMKDDQDSEIEIGAGSREEVSRGVDKSPITTVRSSATRKRERATTPPLTPMRVRSNQGERCNISPSSSPKLKTRLLDPSRPFIQSPLAATNVKPNAIANVNVDVDANAKEQEQEQHARTPVNNSHPGRALERSQLSPMKSISLFITPKSGSGKKRSPRSGSPSEAPTLVVPLSSGKKSSVNGEHLTSMSSISRPSKFQF